MATILRSVTRSSALRPACAVRAMPSALRVQRHGLCTKEEAPAEEAPAPRFAITAEVLASKIFPAGFGWQAASVVADDMGYKATEIPFFVATGASRDAFHGLGGRAAPRVRAIPAS